MTRPAAADLPDWLLPMENLAQNVLAEQLSRFVPPPEGGRESAVLVLFGEGELGPDLLIIQRASTVSSHAGQPAFPGGAVDDSDSSVVAAALREAEEETGVDPSGVHIFGTLPALFLPASGFVVTPVLGWWHSSSPVGVVDPGEVESVLRIPVSEFLDPANRLLVVHPAGYEGLGFDVGGLPVWGSTAGLLSRRFDLCGWELSVDSSVRLCPPEPWVTSST